MRSHDLAKLLLRLAVGGLMLFHGVAKVSHGVAGIAGSVAAHGLPHLVTYGVYFGEVLAPLCVLLGVITRPAAAVMAINMIVAVWLAHTGDLLHLGKMGGYALELQVLYLVGALAIALLGAGQYALRGD